MSEKILILSCHPGGMHDRTAKAIQEEALHRGYECDIKETPASFDKPEALFKNGAYDAIIAVGRNAANTMTAVSGAGDAPVPCCCVLTDYAGIPLKGGVTPALCILPHEDLKKDYLSEGLSTEKLFSFGIPVSSRFFRPISKKGARTDLGIDESLRMYLILAKGMEDDTIRDLCSEFICNEDESGHYALYLLTDESRSSGNEGKAPYGDDHHIKVITDRDMIHLYTEAADVMLARADGPVCAQSFALGVPLVLTPAFPGTEEENAAFLHSRKMAYHGRDIPHAVSHAMLLAVDKSRQKEMLDSQRRNFRPDAAALILDELFGKGDVKPLMTPSPSGKDRSSALDGDNFATLDYDRERRTGFAEVIFCPGKADSHLLSIFGSFYKKQGKAFATRASKAQYELIREHYPNVQYDPISGILKLTDPSIPADKDPASGKFIAVCTAGTADIPVAEEAAQTAEYFGCRVERIYDVGVSGIHRLLNKTETIQKACCVIAVAGMEGALASVIGGLVKTPVIAVPTSVGYGASFEGLSALLTMINSCANGISVVNIDNGFGAGYIGSQIFRLAKDEETSDN